MTVARNEVGMDRKDLFKYTSVQRITKIPVVESGYNYVTNIYTRVKNSNSLVRWSLGNVEGGIQLAVDKTVPTVLLLDLPLTVVDSIICKGLDTVSVAVPAINYPPDQIMSMSKNYVNSNLIKPMMKRADSVKQLGLHEASRVGEMAASRLDDALNIADKYVDRYLPDSTDTDVKKEEKEGESKASQAMHHMNRFGKKLQRRLTKRTLMEAEALKKGGQDFAQTVIYLADLLLRDPKGFADKMTEVWRKLSEDEPENQVPPANLEQLVALLVRESARRTVHIANFIVSTLPAQTAHAFRFSLHHLQYYTNYFLKVVHLEGAKGIAFATSTERLSQLRSFVLHILEVLGSRLKETKGTLDTTPQLMSPTSNSDSNSSTPTIKAPSEQATPNPTQPRSKPQKRRKSKSPQNKVQDESPEKALSADSNSSSTGDSSYKSTSSSPPTYSSPS